MEDVCATCNHAKEAHGYDEDVTAEGFDESAATNKTCAQDGCACTEFVAGGALVSESAQADAEAAAAE